MKNLYLLPTDKPSKLYKVKGKYHIDEYPVQSVNAGNQHIYITNESDIKENDYVIVSCSEVNIEEVRIVTGYYNEQFLFDDKSQIHMDYCKKIILTTDEDLIQNGVQAIDDDFLEWFVKNPSCEEVEIKLLLSDNGNVFYGYKIIILQEEIELNKLKKQFQMKADEALELNSKIGNFGKEEPKQETIEEDAANLADPSLCKTDNWIAGAKYMQEKMYSEEDMREAIRFGLYGMYGYECGEEGQTDNQINKYLKQLKKNKI